MKAKQKYPITMKLGLLAFFCAALLTIFIESISRNYYPQDCDFSYQPATVSLDIESGEVVGYEVIDNSYVQTAPGAYMLFSDLELVLQSVHIIFEEPLEIDMPIALTYASAGFPIDEGQQENLIAEKGATEVSFALPRYEYDRIRISFEGSFVLADISIQGNALVKTIIERPIQWLRVGIVFAGSFILLLLLCSLSFVQVGLLQRRKKLSAFFMKAKSNIKQILAISGIVAATIGISYFIERILSDHSVNKTVPFNVYRFAFILTVLLVILCFVLLRIVVKTKPEKLFLCISLLICTLFACSLPIETNIVWDDQIHYQQSVIRSYVGEVHFTQADDGMINMWYKATGTEPPFSIANTVKQIGDMNEDKLEGTLYTNGNHYTKLYQEIGYLPVALVFFLGRIFSLPFALTFIFGRLISGLIYSFVVYAALKRLKSGKMIMSIIALFPTAVLLATGYNYDYWVTSFLMLGIACFISEMQQPEKKITIKEMVFMIGAFVIGLGPKAIYFPLLLMLLFLRKNKFATEKQSKCFRAAVILATGLVVSSFVILILANPEGASDMRGGADVDAIAQVKYVLSNPLEYAKTLALFFKGYLSPLDSDPFMVFCAYLGMGSKQVWMLLLLTLAVTTFIDKGPQDIYVKGWVRAATLGLCLVALVLVASSLYASFTPVAAQYVAGCQPRYLIPLLFPALYMLGSPRIENKMNKAFFHMAVLGISSFGVLYTFYEVCISKFH